MSASARLAQARNWRLMAFGCLALSTGPRRRPPWQSACGPGDPMDRARSIARARCRAIAPAAYDYQPTDPQIAFHLARFIEDVRVAVRSDRAAPGTGCAPTTSSPIAALWRSPISVRNADPFAKIGKMQVTIEISSVIRASPESFRIA